MSQKEIIESSFSIGDFTLRIFGRSNGKYISKATKILEENGYTLDFFKGKNKNRKYDIGEKECPVCSKKFETKIGHKKELTCCSVSCANSFKPKRQKENNRITKKRIKTKKKKECIICNSIFIGTKKARTCSKNCSNELQRNIQKQKVLSGEHKGWTSRNITSYPEEFFKGVLDNMGVKYSFNHPVTKTSLGIKSSSCYFLDFYIEIENRKIDLEIDGKQHKYLDRIESDKTRDTLLKENGYEVYRIEWKNPINEKNKEYIGKEIEKLRNYFVY